MIQTGAKMEKDLIDEIKSDLEDFPDEKVIPSACSIKVRI